jgi:hypothetical protein
MAISTNNRLSQRLREQKKQDNLLLAIFKSYKTAQMRLLWNELSEEQVELPFPAFKEDFTIEKTVKNLM